MRVFLQGDEMQGKSVLTMQQYGRVRLTLREVMDARGITRGALARVCFVPECDVSDILHYENAGKTGNP